MSITFERRSDQHEVEAFDRVAVGQLRPLGEPLATLEGMQAELAAHGSPEVGQPEAWVPDQRAPLEPQGERPSVGCAFPAFGCFKPM